MADKKTSLPTEEPKKSYGAIAKAQKLLPDLGANHSRSVDETEDVGSTLAIGTLALPGSLLGASGSDKQTVAGEGGEVRLIAFYLPQFHPVPENDQWWGKGFTEWPGVASARPLFRDHYQPHIPADLGFYDLRVSETRREQADLARKYGIHGFCYHYYWFSGRKLLDGPLTEMLRSGDPDFPFCICWANEPWSRRWDGSETEVLMQQDHNLEIDKTFIDELIKIFEDSRYIRVNGNPLIVVYRVGILPDPNTLFAHWRDVARRSGFPDLHIVMAETFGLENPYEYGCDAAVEFPPHKSQSPLINGEVADLAPSYSANIYNYEEVVKNEIKAKSPSYLRYRCVMPGWDNTPRRGPAGNIFHKNTPELYELWLSDAIRRTRSRKAPGSQIVFINAWNEWGEGAHLEPDLRNGRSYLEATRRSLAGLTGWQILVQAAKLRFPEASGYIDELSIFLRSYDMTTKYLADKVLENERSDENAAFFDISDTELEAAEIRHEGLCNIERINQSSGPEPVMVRRRGFIQMIGWSFVPGIDTLPDTEGYITLVDTDGAARAAVKISQRQERTDVASYHNAAEGVWSGVATSARLEDVPEGVYKVAIDTKVGFTYYRSVSGKVLHVIS